MGPPPPRTQPPYDGGKGKGKGFGKGKGKGKGFEQPQDTPFPNMVDRSEERVPPGGIGYGPREQGKGGQKNARPPSEPASPRQRPQQPAAPRPGQPGGGAQPGQILHTDAAQRFNIPPELPTNYEDRLRVLTEQLLGQPAPDFLTDFRPPDYVIELAAKHHLRRQDPNYADELPGMFQNNPWLWMTDQCDPKAKAPFDCLTRIWETVWNLSHLNFNLFRLSPRVAKDATWRMGEGDYPSPRLWQQDFPSAAENMRIIYAHIARLLPGGIMWRPGLTPEQVELARFWWMHQMGTYLELWFPHIPVEVIGLDMDFPQVYILRCPYCGRPIFLDLWGLPVRVASESQEYTGDRRFILSIHRCDRRRGPYYREGHDRWDGDNLTMGVRRVAESAIVAFHNAQYRTLLFWWQRWYRLAYAIDNADMEYRPGWLGRVGFTEANLREFLETNWWMERPLFQLPFPAGMADETLDIWNALRERWTREPSGGRGGPPGLVAKSVSKGNRHFRPPAFPLGDDQEVQPGELVEARETVREGALPNTPVHPTLNDPLIPAIITAQRLNRDITERHIADAMARQQREQTQTQQRRDEPPPERPTETINTLLQCVEARKTQMGKGQPMKTDHKPSSSRGSERGSSGNPIQVRPSGNTPRDAIPLDNTTAGGSRQSSRHSSPKTGDNTQSGKKRKEKSPPRKEKSPPRRLSTNDAKDEGMSVDEEGRPWYEPRTDDEEGFSPDSDPEREREKKKKRRQDRELGCRTAKPPPRKDRTPSPPKKKAEDVATSAPKATPSPAEPKDKGKVVVPPVKLPEEPAASPKPKKAPEEEHLPDKTPEDTGPVPMEVSRDEKPNEEAKPMETSADNADAKAPVGQPQTTEKKPSPRRSPREFLQDVLATAVDVIAEPGIVPHTEAYQRMLAERVRKARDVSSSTTTPTSTQPPASGQTDAAGDTHMDPAIEPDAPATTTIPKLEDRVRAHKEKHGEYRNRSVNAWPRGELYANEDTFYEYCKMDCSSFVQNFEDRFVFEVEDDETVQFVCSMCHALRRDRVENILFHVCTPDWRTKAHYVPNCIAILCYSCINTMHADLYCERKYGCINCRTKNFFLGTQETRVLVGRNEDLGENYRRFQGSPEGREPSRPTTYTDDWSTMCRHGMGDEMPMPVAMAAFRGYVEANEEDPRLEMAYFRGPTLEEYDNNETRRSLDVPNFANKQEWHAWWRENCRPWWSKANWLYHMPVNTYNVFWGTHPGMASQCPQNQPLRDLPVMPVFLTKEYWNHFRSQLELLCPNMDKRTNQWPKEYEKEGTPDLGAPHPPPSRPRSPTMSEASTFYPSHPFPMKYTNQPGETSDDDVDHAEVASYVMDVSRIHGEPILLPSHLPEDYTLMTTITTPDMPKEEVAEPPSTPPKEKRDSDTEDILTSAGKQLETQVSQVAPAPDNPTQCLLPVLGLPDAGQPPMVGSSTTAVHGVDYNTTRTMESLVDTENVVPSSGPGYTSTYGLPKSFNPPSPPPSTPPSPSPPAPRSPEKDEPRAQVEETGSRDVSAERVDHPPLSPKSRWPDRGYQLDIEPVGELSDNPTGEEVVDFVYYQRKKREADLGIYNPDDREENPEGLMPGFIVKGSYRVQVVEDSPSSYEEEGYLEMDPHIWALPDPLQRFITLSGDDILAVQRQQKKNYQHWRLALGKNRSADDADKDDPEGKIAGWWEYLPIGELFTYDLDEGVLPSNNLAVIRKTNYPPITPIPFQIEFVQNGFMNVNACARKLWSQGIYVNQVTRLDRFYQKSFIYKSGYEMSRSSSTLLGTISTGEVPDTLRQRLEDQLKSQRRPPPAYAYHFALSDVEHLRPNYCHQTGWPRDDSTAAVKSRITELHERKILIIGFFDATLGYRPYAGVREDDPVIHREVLEMSLANAFQEENFWKEEDRFRQFNPEFRERMERMNLYRTGTWKDGRPEDILHIMTSSYGHWPEIPGWSKDSHEVEMGYKAYRQAFLAIYEEEEYKFQYEHSLTCWPSPYRLQYDYEWRLSTGDLSIIAKIDDVELEQYFPHPAEAMAIMREYINQLTWNCGLLPTQTAIAVADYETATVLRNRLGYRGHIIDLTSLDYPGMDSMPACEVACFAECGLSLHMPHVPGQRRHDCKDAEKDGSIWSPTGVQRPSGRFGYLKCTMRHVQLMRTWTNLWYSPLVQQRYFTDLDYGIYVWEEHDDVYDQWMTAYEEDLKKLFAKPTA